MAVGEVLMLLFMIFSSIGISFTSASVGESLQDAFSNGHIEFPAADPSARDTFKEMMDANQGLSEFVIPPEAVNSDGNVSASDLAAAGVNPAEWMQENQLNINKIPSGGLASFSLGNGFSIEFYPRCRGGYESDVYDLGFKLYNANGNIIADSYKSAAALATDQYPVPIWDIRDLFVDDEHYLNITFTKSKGSYTLEDHELIYLDSYGIITDDTPILPDDIKQEFGDAVIGSLLVGSDIYQLNPDGTVTIDGTDYTMNPDGTVTIDGVTYYPQIALPGYNDEALQNLLRQILSKLNELENKLEFEDAAEEDIAVPEISYDGTMSELLYNSPKWAQVFPFCLPWDFVRGVKLLSADPVAPVFKIPFDIPQIGAFPGQHYEIVLDFSEYDKYFVVVRWFSTVFFVMGLIFITFKIVKGAK